MTRAEAYRMACVNLRMLEAATQRARDDLYDADKALTVAVQAEGHARAQRDAARADYEAEMLGEAVP